MKLPINLLRVLFIFSLVACSNNPVINDGTQVESVLKDEQLAQGAAMPTKEIFGVSISVSNQYKVNEIFEVEAQFRNLSENPYEMERRSKLFYFYIADENNKIVNTFVTPDMMISGQIQKNQMIKEQYQYKLDKPGQYDVWAVAKFAIVIEGNQQEYEIETKRVSIEIN